MADIIQKLRRSDFNHGTDLALQHVMNTCARLHAQHVANNGNNMDADEITYKVINDFIFLENQPLTAMQQLQLVYKSHELFNKHAKNMWLYHCFFRLLFNESPLPRQRQNVLCQLISMAIGTQCSPVLNASAEWMQIQGFASDACTDMVKSIIQDYHTFQTDSLTALRHLTHTSQCFTSNFITTLTYLYGATESDKSQKPLLPQAILELVVEWFSVDVSLGIISLSNANNLLPPSRSWTSPTKSNSHTPIPGLVRWCTQAPLCATHSNKSDKLWSQLHLFVLQTISTFTSLPNSNQLELITISDMSRTVRDLVTLMKKLSLGSSTGDVQENNVQLQVALDRLVQILQVSLANGGFRCSLRDLKTICNDIPETRLLSVLKQQHLSLQPPAMHYERR